MIFKCLIVNFLCLKNIVIFSRITNGKKKTLLTYGCKFASLCSKNIKKPHLIISLAISNNGCSLLSASNILNDIFQTENSNNTTKDNIKKLDKYLPL